MDPTERRLTRLEEAVGFTDHAVSELNAALIEAQKRIDLLEQMLRALRARVDAAAAPPNPDEEAPGVAPMPEGE